ncbi:MAG: ATP-binding protein, partial [Clostridia bacterium]|nr:ATP-binding protein [Clostridia bacterium]
MLINYSFCNFRSFKDYANLSMKASRQTTFNENLIRKFDERILPSAVIYGANASGKSNILSSLFVFKNIVLAGSISNSSQELSNLELYPFAHN